MERRPTQPQVRLPESDASADSNVAECYDPARVDFSVPMSQFEKISMPGTGVIPERKEDFEKIIETPALKGVLALYDKNIRTLSHDANSEQVGGFAAIIIDWSSLSDENKRVAEDLGLTLDMTTYDGLEQIALRVPVSEQDTIGDVSEALFAAQQAFAQQDVLYGFDEVTDGYVQALTEGLIGYEALLSGDAVTIDEALSIVRPSCVYFGQENRVFATQELLDKHRQFLERQ